MHTTTLLAAFFFSALTAASPVPADVNVPISDAEWAALRDDGLDARGMQASVNQPITDAEWAALDAEGLQRRDGDVSLVPRDKILTCGHLVSGKGGSNGHGVWVPVSQFLDVADTFCKSTPFCTSAFLLCTSEARKESCSLMLQTG